MPSRVSRLLANMGACQNARDWAEDYEDISEAWNACPDGSWMAWVIMRLGFSHDRVMRVVLLLCGDVELLHREIRTCTRSRLPISCMHAVRRFCQLSGIGLDDVAILYRDAFPLAEVSLAVDGMWQRVMEEEA